MIKLKNNVTFDLKSGELNDVRIAFMLAAIKNSENTNGWTPEKYCERINEEFNVKLTKQRLNYYYLVKEEEENTGVHQRILGYHDYKH